MMSPAIGAEIEEGSSQSVLRSTLEKRKHAETEEESLQSPPTTTGKRNRGANEEQPPRGKQSDCECKDEKHEGCGGRRGGGKSEETGFPKLSAFAQNYFLKLKAIHGDKMGVDYVFSDDSEDEEEIGDIGLLFGERDPNWEDCSYCCSNPFIPLCFQEDTTLYNELRVFGVKAVAHFNALYRDMLRFEDIETVSSCTASCQHHLLTIKVIDPSHIISVIDLRGKVRRGFLEAEVEEFVTLGFY